MGYPHGSGRLRIGAQPHLMNWPKEADGNIKFKIKNRRKKLERNI